MSSEFKNKTIVVTGSTRGIGHAIAIEFARLGGNVIIHGAKSKNEANQLAAVVKDMGVDALVAMCDLRDTEAIENFVEEAFAWKDNVDVWINNAGFDVLTGDAAKLSFDAKLDQLWQTDVMGTIRCSRLVGERMKRAGQGVIVNTGWDQAWQGMEGDSGEMFATSKGAIMAFTMSLAKSLAPEVRVNCVAPGWIKTEWGETQASDYWHQRAINESLRGRWGTPEDIVAAVRFLASTGADFITGQILPVNGGFRAATQNKSQNDKN